MINAECLVGYWIPNLLGEEKWSPLGVVAWNKEDQGEYETKIIEKEKISNLFKDPIAKGILSNLEKIFEEQRTLSRGATNLYFVMRVQEKTDSLKDFTNKIFDRNVASFYK